MKNLRAAILWTTMASAMLVDVAAAQTVKVGLLQTYSGPLANMGELLDRGVKLYVKEHEKDLGNIKLEIIRRDEAFSADVSKQRLQELIVRDKIDILAGILGSHVALAIAPLVNEVKLPTVLFNASTSSVTTASPYYVRSGVGVWQLAYASGKWAAQSGIKSVDIAVSDMSVGNDHLEAFSKGFTEGGGQVRNVIKIPMTTTDFAPFVQRIKDAKPEALFTFNATPTPFVKTVMDLGLDTAGIRLIMGGEMISEMDLPNLTNLRPGITTLFHYSSAGDRPANKAFLDAWKREYGDQQLPSFVSLAGWDGMDMIFNAIKAQGGKLNSEKTNELLRNYRSANSPRGPVAVDPATGDMVQNIYVRRLVNRDGKFLNEEIETLPMVKDPWRSLHGK